MRTALVLNAVLVSSQPVLPQDPPTTRPMRWFHGRVLDTRGEPIAGVGFVFGPGDRLETSAAIERPLARSGDDGRFELSTLWPAITEPAMALHAAARGRVAVRWVSFPKGMSAHGSDVDLGDVVMPEGATIKGRVRGEEGKPVARAHVRAADLAGPKMPHAMLYASYAWSDAEGVFELPCVYADALRVSVDAEGHYHRSLSPAGAGRPLVFELSESGFVEGRVLGPDGKPCRATVRVIYEVDHYDQSVVTAEDGAFKLTVLYPCRFRVAAALPVPGSSFALSDVFDGPRRRVELRTPAVSPYLVSHTENIQVGSGGVIEGLVVDDVTEKPLEGARVTWHAVSEDDPFPPAREGPSVTTTAGGIFRVTGLAEGKFALRALFADRSSGKPLLVEMKERQRRTGIELRVAIGYAFSGKVSGARVGRGWLVRIREQTPDPRFFPVLGRPSIEVTDVRMGAVPLAEDGSFRFEGRSPGVHASALLIPTHPRSGAMFQISLAHVLIRKGDLFREFDVSSRVPGRVVGKVTVEGAHVTTGRLLVVAQRLDAGEVNPFGPDDLCGRRCVVGQDGGYGIDLEPGMHQLKVVDLPTGILLWQGKRRVEVEASALAEEDIALQVGEVKVRLKPTGKRWVASRLLVETEMRSQQDDSPKAVWWSRFEEWVPPGIDLAEGPSEVSFFVPPGETKLTVWSSVWRIAREEPIGGGMAELGSAEVFAEAGKAKTVTVEVAPPPELPEAERR